MPGQPMASMLPNEFSQMPNMTSPQAPILTSHSTTTLIPSSAITARAGVNPHMPAPFHAFAHPEFLMKNPFLSYDLANLRGMQNTRPLHPMAQHDAMTMNLNSSRVSPVSSRPSTSSPPSSSPQSAGNSKLNSSIDIESDDASDDDVEIDVVKSAFVPIIRPSSDSMVSVADSTTIHDQTDVKPIKVRCELKAPSAMKPVHETAPRARTPETRLKSPISTHKTVWRPY